MTSHGNTSMEQFHKTMSEAENELKIAQSCLQFELWITT